MAHFVESVHWGCIVSDSCLGTMYTVIFCFNYIAISRASRNERKAEVVGLNSLAGLQDEGERRETIAKCEEVTLHST